MPTVSELLADLAAEQGSLAAVVEPAEPESWRKPTGAAGWDVADCISHLEFFERAAATALRSPEEFAQHRKSLLSGTTPDPDVALGRTSEPSELLAAWKAAAAEFSAAAAGAPPGTRVPWYGPDMSVASFVTARIQETWAHGVDVREALAAPLAVTPRLRHVCHLAYTSRPFSFAVHGREDPGDPVRFELAAPDGEPWAWGPPDAADVIRGSALDVALVWTQRRHPSRTSLTAEGDTAKAWLSVAQSFAGPPTLPARDR